MGWAFFAKFGKLTQKNQRGVSKFGDWLLLETKGGSLRVVYRSRNCGKIKYKE